MSQVALDVDDGVRTVAQLHHVDDVVRVHRGAVLRPPIGFPPALAATTMGEQAAIMAGLEAGRAVTERLRVTLATRTTLFVAAGGGGLSDAQLEQLGRAMQSADLNALMEGVLDVRSAINDALDVAEVALFAGMSLGRWHQGGLPISPTAFHKWWKKGGPLPKQLGPLQKVLGHPAFRVLSYAHGVRTNYDKSSAQTVVGRGISSFVGTTSGFVVGKHPLGAFVDQALGGVVVNTADSLTVIGEEIYFGLSGDPRAGLSAQAFSDAAQAGDKGWFAQFWNAEGEMIVSVGDAIASGSMTPIDDWSREATEGKHGPVVEAIADTGDFLGGELYDAWDGLFH